MRCSPEKQDELPASCQKNVSFLLRLRNCWVEHFKRSNQTTGGVFMSMFRGQFLVRIQHFDGTNFGAARPRAVIGAMQHRRNQLKFKIRWICPQHADSVDCFTSARYMRRRSKFDLAKNPLDRRPAPMDYSELPPGGQNMRYRYAFFGPRSGEDVHR
jgi:hypothetical protein